MPDEQPGGKPKPVTVGGALMAVHEEQRAGLLAGTVHRQTQRLADLDVITEHPAQVLATCFCDLHWSSWFP